MVKVLIPGIADALSEEEYEQFVTFIRLKGERFLEAKSYLAEGWRRPGRFPANVTWKAADRYLHREDPMDEERFNLSVRALLKHFGVMAQREIEKAVDAARQSGALAGRDALQAGS